MSRSATRLSLVLVLVAALVASAVGVSQAGVRAPRSGSEYRSPPPEDVILRVSGRSVELVAMSFPCKGAFGRTTLNDFRLKRTSRGYRFNADANGLVSYSDEAPDENARVHISGRFTKDARAVRGHIRVRSPRCGDTGYLKWRASR